MKQAYSNGLLIFQRIIPDFKNKKTLLKFQIHYL
jgi:hypothetical protein